MSSFPKEDRNLTEKRLYQKSGIKTTSSRNSASKRGKSSRLNPKKSLKPEIESNGQLTKRSSRGLLGSALGADQGSIHTKSASRVRPDSFFDLKTKKKILLLSEIQGEFTLLRKPPKTTRRHKKLLDSLLDSNLSSKLSKNSKKSKIDFLRTTDPDRLKSPTRRQKPSKFTLTYSPTTNTVTKIGFNPSYSSKMPKSEISTFEADQRLYSTTERMVNGMALKSTWEKDPGINFKARRVTEAISKKKSPGSKISSMRLAKTTTGFLSERRKPSQPFKKLSKDSFLKSNGFDYLKKIKFLDFESDNKATLSPCQDPRESTRRRASHSQRIKSQIFEKKEDFFVSTKTDSKNVKWKNKTLFKAHSSSQVGGKPHKLSLTDRQGSMFMQLNYKDQSEFMRHEHFKSLVSRFRESDEAHGDLIGLKKVRPNSFLQSLANPPKTKFRLRSGSKALLGKLKTKNKRLLTKKITPEEHKNIINKHIEKICNERDERAKEKGYRKEMNQMRMEMKGILRQDKVMIKNYLEIMNRSLAERTKKIKVKQAINDILSLKRSRKKRIRLQKEEQKKKKKTNLITKTFFSIAERTKDEEDFKNMDLADYKKKLEYQRIQSASDSSFSSDSDYELNHKNKWNVVSDNQIFEMHQKRLQRIFGPSLASKRQPVARNSLYRPRASALRQVMKSRHRARLGRSVRRNSQLFYNGSKRRLKNFGKKLLNFMHFMSTHNLRISDLERCPLFLKPHHLGQESKRFFTLVKTGNHGMVQAKCYDDKLMSFQIDITGKTPAHWAVMRNDPSMLKILIRFKAPLDVKDFKGRTPLSFAVENINRVFKQKMDKLRKLGNSFGFFHQFTESFSDEECGEEMNDLERYRENCYDIINALLNNRVEPWNDAEGSYKARLVDQRAVELLNVARKFHIILKFFNRKDRAKLWGYSHLFFRSSIMNRLKKGLAVNFEVLERELKYDQLANFGIRRRDSLAPDD